MEPAVRVALTGRSRVYTTDDIFDFRRKAEMRDRRPRLRTVPTAEFHSGNRKAAVNHPHRINHHHQTTNTKQKKQTTLKNQCRLPMCPLGNNDPSCILYSGDLPSCPGNKEPNACPASTSHASPCGSYPQQYS